MRNMALVLVLAAACGGGKKDNGKKDGGTQPPSDGTSQACATPQTPLPACTPVNGTNIKVRQIGRVSGGAMLATSPPNDGRLFVVEQQGRIRIIENEMLKTEAFLDVTGVPNFAAGGEQGLLGLAFHPDYCNNRQFFVFYTTGGCPGANCANVVARYTASATDPNKADATGEVILTIPDFATNHNGGMMEFGKDGFLYIGTGDGGGGGDPQRNGQDPNKLLGKMLRIDVNSEANGKKYAIPTDNPYASGGGAPEVFMLGLRNPWRWSFDRETGDMWIADVGQDVIEELTVVKAGSQKGANLGWSKYEATRCYGNVTPCNDNENNANGFTGPQFTKTHQQNWLAIIGGTVYRGSCFPDLKGTYFMTDNNAHPLTTAKLDANGTVTPTDIAPPTGGWPTSPASIFADARGELYMTNTAGYVYAIEASP